MWKNIIFAAWFIALGVPLTMTMGGHFLSLNPSKKDELRTLSTTKSDWTIMHFVNPDCGCSERVVGSLLKRPAKTDGVSERVYVLGRNDAWVRDLSQRGYDVIEGKMDHFAEKYAINAVPQLVILSAEHVIRYSGGYTSKRGPASVVEDEDIFRSVKASANTTERPIFGCVNGKTNQKRADFVGAKY